MGVKNILREDLKKFMVLINARRKDEGKEVVAMKFKGSEIQLSLQSDSEGVKNLNVDMDMLLYKLSMGEDAFAFFATLVNQMDRADYDFKKEGAWQTYRHFVYPIIKDSKYQTEFNSPNGDKDTTLISIESPIPHTKVLFVIDDQHQMMYVSNYMLDDFGVTKEQLIEEAYMNLKTNIGLKLEEGNANGHKTLVSETMDGFDASRILILEENEIRERIGADHYIIIPDRDLLLIVEKKEETRMAMGLLAKNRYAGSRYCISSEVYEWKDDKLIVAK